MSKSLISVMGLVN